MYFCIYMELQYSLICSLKVTSHIPNFSCVVVFAYLVELLCLSRPMRKFSAIYTLKGFTSTPPLLGITCKGKNQVLRLILSLIQTICIKCSKSIFCKSVLVISTLNTAKFYTKSKLIHFFKLIVAWRTGLCLPNGSTLTMKYCSIDIVAGLMSFNCWHHRQLYHFSGNRPCSGNPFVLH